MSANKRRWAVVAVVCWVGLCLAGRAEEALVADPLTAPQIQASFEHFSAGDFGRSLESAREALKLNPDSAIAYNNICCAQIRLGAYEQAIAACNRALEIVPEYRLAYRNLVWAYDEAVKHEPSANTLLGLSVLRFWSGELDGSIEASRKVLELEPDNALAHNNICAAHARRGEWDAAIAACEKALALDPELLRARNNLHWARSGKAGAP